MALFQTAVAQGREPALRSLHAGAVIYTRASYTFTTAYNGPFDMIEFACLPAGAIPVRAVMQPTNLSVNAGDVMMLTGDFGDPVSGNRNNINDQVLIDNFGVDSNLEYESTLRLLDTIPVDHHRHRGVAVRMAAPQAVDATASMVLHLWYSQ